MNQILFVYAIGIMLFLFGIEREEREALNKMLYLGLSFFINLIAYLISYTNTDYTLLAYMPLVFLMITTLMLVAEIFTYLKSIVSQDYTETNED